MITNIHLEHFKCFQQASLPFGRLTILTGLNASGKSTVMQALLLLHQTLVENENSRSLILNGQSVSLGAVDEVVNKVSGRSHFVIGVENEQIRVDWRITAAERGAMSGRVDAIGWATQENGEGNYAFPTDGLQLRALLPTLLPEDVTKLGADIISSLRTLTYLSADRIGPQEAYPASSEDQYSGVGTRGEYAPWFVTMFGKLDVPEALCVDGTPQILERQVEGWLRQFFPGSRLEIDALPLTNLVVMKLRTSDATDFHRPMNVGFGISHTLPTIVACLGSVTLQREKQTASSLLLIENPELHLHPGGQSKMGYFLAQTSAAGAQVCIETHSDHILNGIRRAVRDGLIAATQVTIHFFINADEDGSQRIIQPRIHPSGGIEPWPAGFFDQLDKDLVELL